MGVSRSWWELAGVGGSWQELWEFVGVVGVSGSWWELAGVGGS